MHFEHHFDVILWGSWATVVWSPDCQENAMRLNIRGLLFWGGWYGVSSARPRGLVTLTVKPNSNGLLPAQTTDTHTGGVHLCGYVNAVLTERCWGLEASPQGGTGFRTLLNVCVCVCVFSAFWPHGSSFGYEQFVVRHRFSSLLYLPRSGVCVHVCVNVYLRKFVFVVIS